MNEEMLHYFKIGYTINKKCDDGYWDNLELFIDYRTAFTYLSLCEIDEIGVTNNTDKILHYLCYIILSAFYSVIIVPIPAFVNISSRIQ